MSWTLVTGGAKRLGAEICRVLSEQKCNLLIHYHESIKEAENVSAECRSHGVNVEIIKGDFSTQEKTEAFISEIQSNFQNIENLINNVGNFLKGPASTVAPTDWQTLFQVNFHAPVILIQELLPSIRAHKGAIINLGTSGIGSMKADIKYPAYTSTKSALLWITKSLARELASSGVRVNMVSPGQLDISVEPTDPFWPIERVGTCREVAEMIAFLLKKENCYITGQNIEVAGGLGL